MNFVSYSVETKAGPELAWDVYADWKLWRGYSDAFGEIPGLFGTVIDAIGKDAAAG